MSEGTVARRGSAIRHCAGPGCSARLLLVTNAGGDARRSSFFTPVSSQPMPSLAHAVLAHARSSSLPPRPRPSAGGLEMRGGSQAAHRVVVTFAPVLRSGLALHSAAGGLEMHGGSPTAPWDVARNGESVTTRPDLPDSRQSHIRQGGTTEGAPESQNRPLPGPAERLEASDQPIPAPLGDLGSLSRRAALSNVILVSNRQVRGTGRFGFDATDRGEWRPRVTRLRTRKTCSKWTFGREPAPQSQAKLAGYTCGQA